MKSHNQNWAGLRLLLLVVGLTLAFAQSATLVAATVIVQPISEQQWSSLSNPSNNQLLSPLLSMGSEAIYLSNNPYQEVQGASSIFASNGYFELGVPLSVVLSHDGGGGVTASIIDRGVTKTTSVIRPQDNIYAFAVVLETYDYPFFVGIEVNNITYRQDSGVTLIGSLSAGPEYPNTFGGFIIQNDDGSPVGLNDWLDLSAQVKVLTSVQNFPPDGAYVFKIVGARTQSFVTPEPSTAALLVFSALAVIMRRRRKW